MIVLYIVLGIAALYLLFCFFIARFMGKLIYTTPAALVPSKEKVMADIKASYEVDYDDYETWEREDISISNGSYTIPAEYDPIPNARGVAIVVHGFGQNRYAMVAHAKLLRDLGFSTVLFDQRRFGASKASHGGLGYIEREDTAKVIDYVRERFGKDTKIVLIGCSMGAMSVLGSQLFTDEVDAVIADSPPDRAVNVIKPLYAQITPLPNPFQKPIVTAMSRKVGYDITKNNPIEAAAKIKAPVLILHGEADRAVPLQCAYELQRVLKNPISRLETFPGRDHCLEIADKERYTQIVTDFVNAALPAPNQV